MSDQGARHEEIISLVRRLANEIPDPCGLGQGVSIGMIDMGLIRDVQAVPTEEGGWSVTVTIRFTSPNCLYFSYFEEQLEALVDAYEDIKLQIVWDNRFDWTSDEMSPDAHAKLGRVRERIIQFHEKRK